MNDAEIVKRELARRVEELVAYLFPNGKRQGIHWCVGDVTGAPGKSFKICIAGEKAGLWGDFAESGKHSRSLLDLWMHARNVDFKTALREGAEWLGVSLSPDVAQASEGPPSQKLNSKDPTPIDWQRCVDAFTEKHLERLAEWRGYSGEVCSWLKESRLVGLHDNCIAFPVHDRAGKVVAVHYRLKDGSWRYYPQGAKARPLVIGELIAGEPVHVFESQWDCFAFLNVSDERTGVIVTRGASNGALVPDLISESSTVYVWTQNDAPGEKWEKDICANTKAVVTRAKIPAPHKDLNDWTRAGATAEDLLAAMMNAEVVREGEKSWIEALNESVVTSNELRDLQLMPRRKLLGDWFCEGDLGFIFAFRGVGKTWLALATAQTLSTGGKLGDWPGHAPVKVLYIDGEMPPDLMRSRCKGLEAGNDNLQFLNHEILFERSGKVLNITNREIQQAITETCVASGVKVLFLDNLSTLASGMRENEADSWEPCEQLATRFAQTQDRGCDHPSRRPLGRNARYVQA
jgi:AAA domain-containing protein